jgi:S1-C subfamily serine protease
MNIPFLLGLIFTSSFPLSLSPAEVYALTPAQVYDKVKDSVVVVKSLDEQGGEVDLGSGVILPSGKIGTCCHVLEGGVSFQVGRGEKFVPSAFYGGDEDKDICLLEARGLAGKPAQLGRAEDLKAGVPVYAVGAPREPT